MIRLEIPKTNGENVWSRRSFEEWLRVNVLPKGNTFLIRLSQERFHLKADYAYNVPTIVLLHYILDRAIKDNKGPEDIKIEGELMEVSSAKSSDPNGLREYKIKGLSSPREEIVEFMGAFTEKLAYFIKHEWACSPKEGEGVDLDKLHMLVGNRGTPQYLPIPMSAPPIHVIKGARDPSKGTRTKRVVDIQDIQNLEADVASINERLAKLEFSQNQHEGRIMYLEEAVSKRK